MGQAYWNWSEVTKASPSGFDADASQIHQQHKAEGGNAAIS